MAKDLQAWLVSRLQQTKKADAVTDGALKVMEMHPEAARYLPMASAAGPLMQAIKPRYTGSQGVSDLASGAGRGLWETARTLMPFGGHQGANSVGDNLIQAGWQTVNHGAKALGSGLGGDWNAGYKELTRIPQFWGKTMFTQPFERAAQDPNGYIRAGREMTGLWKRYRPGILMGDTPQKRITELPQWYSRYLGTGYQNNDLQAWDAVRGGGNAPGRAYNLHH